MTDISKCEGVDCDKKSMCYRFTCSSNTIQSWTTFWSKGQSECEWFIDNKAEQSLGLTNLNRTIGEWEEIA